MTNKPIGDGCLQEVWAGLSNEALTLLYLGTWSSPLTYRVKVQIMKCWFTQLS